MHTRSLRRQLLLTGTLVMTGLLVATTPRLNAYATSGHAWGISQVPYYVNPSNMFGMSASDVINDLARAASAWPTQANIPVQLQYAGTTSGGTLALDYTNNVFFRNESNSGFAAATYYWYDGTGHLIDFDMEFYEASYPFFANNAGCSGSGLYVQNVATHEFGHSLGMLHSSVSSATMYPTMQNYCDTSWETLDPDDISGIQTLYPPSKTTTTTAPSAPSQLSVALNSSNPTSSLGLAWTDTATNASGYRVERSADGTTFSMVAQLGSTATSYVDSGLQAGTSYYYRVDAYNSAGTSAYSNTASGQTQALTTSTLTAPSAPYSPAPADGTTGVSSTLTLSWSDSGAQSYDVYVNNALYASNLGTSSLSVSLNNSTSYSWTVVAKNSIGTTAGPTWTFTTKASNGRRPKK